MGKKRGGGNSKNKLKTDYEIHILGKSTVRCLFIIIFPVRKLEL